MPATRPSAGVPKETQPRPLPQGAHLQRALEDMVNPEQKGVTIAEPSPGTGGARRTAYLVLTAMAGESSQPCSLGVCEDNGGIC